MKFKKGTFICCVGVMVASYATMKKLRNRLMRVCAIECAIDPRLSSLAHNQLTHFLQKKINGEIADIQDIKTEFPYVKEIEVAQRIQSTQYHITCVNPLVVANEKYLVDEDGRVFDARIFNSSLVRSLHRVSIMHFDDATLLPSAFAGTVKTLLSRYGSSHHITWVDDKTVHMRDNAHHDFGVVCNESVVPDHPLVAQCFSLYEDIHKKLPAAKRSSQQISHHILADIRFKNQIIMKVEKGGHYG